MNLVRDSSGENFLCSFTHSGERMSRGCGKCKSCHVGGRYNATESVTFRRNRREVSSLLERPECAGRCPESLRRLHGANVAKRRHGTALPETVHGHRKTSCALPHDTAYLVIRKREITWFSPLLSRFCLAWSGSESITKAKPQNGEKRLNLGVNEMLYH